MFFDIYNLNADYIETLGFKQEKVAFKMKKRHFCALSIRINSINTIFECNGKKIQVEKGDIVFVPRVDYTRSSDLDETLCIHFNIDKNFSEIEHYRPKNPNLFISLFQQVFNATRHNNSHYDGAKGLYEILSAIA